MADIIDMIPGDHQRIRRLAAVLDQARQAKGSRPAWAVADAWDQLAGLLDMHTSAEEEICYLPMSGNGQAAARELEEARADHADLREAAAEARLQPAGSAQWWHAAGFALATCPGHLNYEESGVLAAFAHRATAAVRHTLGHQWMAFCTARAPGHGCTGAASWPATSHSQWHRPPDAPAALATGKEEWPWRG